MEPRIGVPLVLTVYAVFLRVQPITDRKAPNVQRRSHRRAPIGGFRFEHHAADIIERVAGIQSKGVSSAIGFLKDVAAIAALVDKDDSSNENGDFMRVGSDGSLTEDVVPELVETVL